MNDATEFWAPYEYVIEKLEDFQRFLEGLMERFIDDSERPRRFAWRGVSNAQWPLYSSLYRRACEQAGGPVDESRVCEHEAVLLRDLQRWGLHHGERGPLSALEQLALMQHHGLPTRLLDITFSAHAALWFAVEQRTGGAASLNTVDGRLFAIDVSDRLLNDRAEGALLAGERELPWSPSHPLRERLFADWHTTAYAWRPPPLDRRINAQHGAFLLGGVPSVDKHWQEESADAELERAPVEKLREYTSVALRVHKANARRGRPPAQPFYTARIRAEAKRPILRQLEEFYGYTHATMYPDFAGFADFVRQRPLPPA